MGVAALLAALIGGALTVVPFGPPAAANSPGFLDGSFNNSQGSTTAGLPGAAEGVALQSDGKIISVGTATSTELGTVRKFAVGRHLANGTVDTSFGTNGVVQVQVDGTDDHAHAVVVQPDNKIVVAGESGGDMGVIRLNANGSLDPTFSGDGMAVLQTAGDPMPISVARSVLLQPDGKIVVGGFARSGGTGAPSDFKVVRLTSDGAFDPSFDGDGIAVTDVGGSATDISDINDLTIDGSGRIVAVGFSTASAEPGIKDWAIARYLPSGSLDTTFNGTGKLVTVTSGLAGDDIAYGVGITAEGKIVVAGEGAPNAAGRPLPQVPIQILRLLDSGARDSTFGIGGRSGVGARGNFSVRDLIVQPDGKLVLASSIAFENLDSTGHFDRQISLYRFSPSGSYLSSPTTNFSVGDEIVNALALQPDGRIVGAGDYAPGFLMFRVFGDPPPVVRTGPSGGIVFSSNRSGQHQIWNVSPDTGTVTQLTSSPGPNTDPHWSPDGSSVVFVSQRDGNPEIYKIDVATGSETRLTNNPAHDADPAWSPDGSRIAFASDRVGTNGGFDVYEIPSAGGSAVNLTIDGSGAWDSFPAYDRFGNLLFQSMGRDGADFEIFRRNLGEIPTLDQLTANDVHDQGVQGSPASRDIFSFATQNAGGSYSVHVLDRSGDGVVDTTVTPAAVNADTPTFGPDGRTIAYVDRSAGQADLKILPADGSGGPAIALAASASADEAPNWFDSIVLTANVRSTKASPPAIPLSELRLQEGAPELGFAPIPGLSLAPIPGLSLAPIPGLSLAPIPGLSLAPIPGLSLAPIPGLSLAPIPGLSLAPIPGLSLAPLVAEGYAGVLLSSVPLTRPGGWPAFLIGTPLEGAQPAATTFLDLFQKVPAAKLATLNFGELDFSNSKLGAIHHSSVLLGRTPLSAIQVPEAGFDWCTRLGQLGFSCAGVGGVAASLVDLQVAGVPFNDPTYPIHVHAAKLSAITLAADAPIRTIQLSPLDLGRLNLGAVTTASLANASAVVSCSPGAAGCTTLNEAQDSGHLLSSATFDHLLGSDASDLTLGEIAFGFLPPAANPLGAIDLSRFGVGAHDAPGLPTVDYTARFVAPAGGTGGATSLVVDLPRSAFYVPGSASLAINGVGGAAEPTVTADLTSVHLTWQVSAGLAPRSVATVQLTARPGITIGEFTSGARMISPLANLVASNRAPVQVRENHEDRPGVPAFADNDRVATAAPIEQDRLVLSHIRAGDKDFFSFPAPPLGSRIRVDLGHLRADLDLVLYHPADATPVQPLRQPKTQRAPSLAAPEQRSSLSQFGEPVMPEPGQDLALENLPVAGLGDNRGVVPEVATASSYGSGTYVIQVAGHLGASSDQPYSLRLSVTPPPTLPACTARSFPMGTSTGWPNAGSFPAAISPTTKTLFLLNKDRLTDRWGSTEANRVVAELDLLRSHPKVQGEVLSVESAPGVRASWEAWDANPCEPELANDVVRKINAAIDATLPVGNQLRHIVVVGSSEDMPDAWLPDLTSEGNEATFFASLPAYAQGNNANLTGAARGYLRSLDPYGDLDPEPALNGWKYASDLGLSRLGEDPDAMVSASSRFREFNGLLDAESIKKTLTTGTDFFDDLATNQDATFEAQRGNVAQPDLIGTYTAGEVRTALGGVTGPGIVALNGHGSPTALEAAAPAGSTLAERFLRASEIAATPAPDRRLVLSVGCQTGYTQPDVLFSSPAPPHSLDWSQAIARQGGLFIGQTGYGIGLRTGIALSEELMAEVVKNLDGSMTVGEALVEAKQAYAGGQLTYGAYDTKVVHEAVLSGLPMYEVKAGTPPAGRPTASLGTDPVTGLRTHEIVSTPTLTTETVAGDGTYSKGGTGQIVEQNRPLQPKVEVDLPKDPGLPGHAAHGVVITGLVSSEREADPVLASLTPGADLPESQTKDVIFPAILQNVTTYKSVSGTRQSAVIAAGQFTSTGILNGKTFGVQRDFVRTEATAYYSDSSDLIKPQFHRVDGSVVNQRVAFSTSVTDMFDEVTPGQVVRVVVVYRAKGANTWLSLDLLQAGPGTAEWNGSVPITGDEVEYFAQAVDAAGNVAVTTRKGAFFLAEPLPPIPSDISVQIAGGTPVDGWYDGASVTMTGAPGEHISVSLNGGAPAPHDAPLALGGEQVHRIDYTTSLGRSGSFLVPVDQVGPRAVIRSPKNAATFLLNQSVVADYSCVDAGVGIGPGGGCDGTTADGSNISTSTPGTYSFSVAGVDQLGNAGARVTNSYTVGYQFNGFFAPVDNPYVFNVATGGRTIPVKFRLRDANNAIISDLSSVKAVTSVQVPCSQPLVADVVESLASELEPAGLKYEPIDQQFVYNWKTLKDWGAAKQCRKLIVELQGGAQRAALFQFK